MDDERLKNPDNIFGKDYFKNNWHGCGIYAEAKEDSIKKLPTSILSKREKDILCYIANGDSTKMIAHKLNISENTIANHRKNMMFKTNTKNIAELVAYCIRNKII